MFQFKNPLGLARAAIVGSWIYFAAKAIHIPLALAFVGRLANFDGSTPLPSGSDLSFGTVALLTDVSAIADLLLLIVVGTLILCWIYRVNANVHAIGGQIAAGPGWTVGSFFVPFWNLVRPFQGVREAWQGTLLPETPYQVEVPPVLRWWWGLWLIGNFTSNIGAQFSLGNNTVGGREFSLIMEALSCAVMLATTVLLVRIIRQLSGWQKSHLQAAVFA